MFWRILDFLAPPPRKLRDGTTQTYHEWKRLHRKRQPEDVKGPIKALDIVQSKGV